MRKIYEDEDIVVVDEMPAKKKGAPYLAVVAMVFLIIGALFGIFYNRTVKANKSDVFMDEVAAEETTKIEEKEILEEEEEVVAEEPQKVIITKEEVEAKLSEIGELATYSGEYHVTKSFEMPKNYWFLDVSKNLDVECDGIVKVGCEIADIKVEVLEDTIVFSLPETKVLDNYVILDSVNFDIKQSILNMIGFEDYQSILADVEQTGLEQAEGFGIYDVAETRLENIIRNYMGEFTDYEVRFM